jgi:hypothetical protein
MRQFLSRADDLVQKAFDAFIFFLMRRFGWKKSFIRYALNALQILTVAGTAMCNWQVAAWRSVMPFSIFIVVMLIFFQKSEYDRDRRAEERGMVSANDRVAGVIGPFKFIFWIFLVMDVLYLTRVLDYRSALAIKVTSEEEWRWVDMKKWWSSGFDLFILASYYLLRTPNVPPPLEEKAPVLVPVASRS